MLKKTISSFIALLMCVLNLAPAPEKKCESEFNGTFIQAWYCVGWDDARWQQEIDCMKEAGIDYLILQTLASMDADGNWTVYYPTSIESFKDNNGYGDVIDGALKNCEKGGIKVFIGLAEFEAWWIIGGLFGQYTKVCKLMTEMEKEIYNNYYSKYPNAFYGWYFSPEINNIPTMKASIGTIIRGFNKVVDTANELDSSLPMLLSPYYTEYYSIPSVLETLPMWQTFLRLAHLRDNDIFCPQDAVGAGWIQKDDLEKVWQMYASAMECCKNDVKLWANCETLTVARAKVILSPPETLEKVNSSATLDRFVYQMDVASRYAENIITFSFSHYDSLYSGNRAYYDTYLDYLANSHALEKVAPTAPQNVNLNGTSLSWTPSTDNIGIAYYFVFRDGKAVARVEGTEATQLTVDQSGTYTVVAVDAAGNFSS